MLKSSLATCFPYLKKWPECRLPGLVGDAGSGSPDIFFCRIGTESMRSARVGMAVHKGSSGPCKNHLNIDIRMGLKSKVEHLKSNIEYLTSSFQHLKSSISIASFMLKV